MRLPWILPLLLAAACSASPEAEREATPCFATDALSGATTKTELLANNTSASSLFRDRYTPASRFNGAVIGVVSNGDAPVPATVASSLAVGAVSKVPTRSLLYPGATTKVFVETQSWFCTNGNNPLATGLGTDQCGSHIDIGYDSSTTAHVQKEIDDMMSRGIDGVIADWGGSAHTTVNQTLIETMHAAEATKGKFEFAALEDEGIKDCVGNDVDCTQTLLRDLTYLSQTFFGSPAYYKQGGRPVVFFFSLDTWVAPKTIDWAYVRAHAPGNPLFVFENAGGYGHAATDGAYAWLHPTAIESYPGSDPFDDKAFLPYFYQQAAAHASKLTFGSAFKGFDDRVVNAWLKPPANTHRYIGQQCGKTWLDTFASVNARYSSSAQLEGLQLVTWDDYEEGSELETGIESWVTIGAQVAGSKLSWSVARSADAPPDCVTAVNAGFDLTKTIHHFTVYASPVGDGENLSLVADDLPATTRALDLTGRLPSGNWQLYVYAVSQPSLRNHLSAPVTASGSAPPPPSPPPTTPTPPPPPPPTDGCAGNPTILEPTHGESVGPAIRLRASAPSCIHAMIAYLDGVEVARVDGNAIDQWVGVAMGGHRLNVNGWAGTSLAHASTPVTFTRTY